MRAGRVNSHGVKEHDYGLSSPPNHLHHTTPTPKCKAKNVSNDVLASIVKILKANMLVHPELNGLIFDGKPSKIEKDTKDVKLIEIKRLGTKKTMFVSKSRSFSDQSAIVPQLKILQGQLSIVVDELLEKMILQ